MLRVYNNTARYAPPRILFCAALLRTRTPCADVTDLPPLSPHPFLHVPFHRYVDQGGGKRKGAFAIYLEPWHADIADFLSLRKNHGDEESRARDLFYGLWVPDLFMKRVEV